MTTPLTPAMAALDDDYQALLLQYRPRCLSAELWAVVRGDVLDLVAKCVPTFPKEVAMLGGSLCGLIGAFAVEFDEPHVSTLLTQRNVDRLIAKFHADSMNKGSIGQQQNRLRRLLRVHQGRAKQPTLPQRRVRDLQPYSAAEVRELACYFDEAPAAVRQSGLDALLLGLGHGIVLPQTEQVARDERGRLTYRGRPLDRVSAWWGPVLQAHQASAAPLPRKDWEGLRAWMQWQYPDLDFSAQRLRDTWILFRTSATAGVTPLVVLMAEDGVGRERLMLAAAEPLEDPDAWAAAIRNF